MAYNRTKWKNHSVVRPQTYTEVTNADGSVTHTPAPVEVVMQGTPQSAENFNNIEDALQNLCVAFDMLATITDAIIRSQQNQIEEMQASLDAIT